MNGFERRYESAVSAALAERPAPHAPLAAADLASLPEPVRRYVLASGAVGRAVPRSVRVELDALMRRSPGGRPMSASSEQVNTLDRISRSFLMRSRMYGLPVRALHLYREDEATFQVRVAGLVDIVDMRGDTLSTGETVTVLNDLCVFAPGCLADRRLTWQPIDERCASVTFENGRRRVSATLRFDAADRLVDFWSDDRPEAIGRQLVAHRWRTPLADHREFAGLRLAGRAAAVYERPDGPFTYGEFSVRSVSWD